MQVTQSGYNESKYGHIQTFCNKIEETKKQKNFSYGSDICDRGLYRDITLKYLKILVFLK